MALYAVPAVSLDFENEFLRGAALALLVLAFLRLEKLRVGDAGNAGLVAAGGGRRGADAGPGARQATRRGGTTRAGRSAPPPRARPSFSWDHDYGPLDWPRDGRELLRVRADEAARVLEGRQPRPPSTAAAGSRTSTRDDDPGMPENAEAIKRGHAGDQGHDPQPLQPGLHHRRLHGLPRVADDARDAARRRHVGWRAAALRRGDAYTALVYTPSTNESQRREAGNEIDRADLARFRALILPAQRRPLPERRPAVRRCCSRPSASSRRSSAGSPGATASRSTSAQILAALERRPVPAHVGARAAAARRGRDAGGPRPVGAHLPAARLRLHRDAAAGGLQPRGLPVRRQGRLLPAVLGRDGAAAADGRRARRAWSPASPPGSLDSKTKEYVVRDLDAHSWVEVWYRGIGWVTFDPTPAAAPARSQPNEEGATSGPGASVGPPSLGGDLPSDPGRRAAGPRGGHAVGADRAHRPSPGWRVLAVAASGCWRCGAVAAPARRRPRWRSPSSSARCAARAAIRAPAPRCARSRSASPAAPPPPATCAPCATCATAAARAARRPRSAAGCAPSWPAGMGLTGRLRAWWALPPRAH